MADGFSELPTNGDRDHIGGVDIVYLKNVLLKFLDSLASGRTEQVSLHSLVQRCLSPHWHLACPLAAMVTCSW